MRRHRPHSFHPLALSLLLAAMSSACGSSPGARAADDGAPEAEDAAEVARDSGAPETATADDVAADAGAAETAGSDAPEADLADDGETTSDSGGLPAGTCSDGTKGETESDVDCGGACEACPVGRLCAVDADCASHLCQVGVCALATTCDDGVEDGTETDVDCGGDCQPCPAGLECVIESDCESGVCSQSKCAAGGGSCTDGAHSGDETGVDCGGPCFPCPGGQPCNTWTDCLSSSCVAGVCTAGGVACANKIQDEDESDVDCGGSCPACAVGAKCSGWMDCVSKSCGGGVCTGGDGGATCTDGVKDGLESDVDCGGGVCKTCENLHACATSTDCLTSLCGADGKCHGPTCYNSKLDGTESDNDCGGDCEPCKLYHDCNTDADCGPLMGCSVKSNTCQDTCDDGKKSPMESDVDCGGNCLHCSLGEACGSYSDCEFYLCSAGKCALPMEHCFNGVLDGGETALFHDDLAECGGDECPPCDYGLACAVAADCSSALCVGGVCAAPAACMDEQKSAKESDVDCGGPLCAPCIVGQVCAAQRDCFPNACVSHQCAVPTCSDGVQDGAETDLDCGGSVCSPCQDGYECVVGSDCVGGVCTGGRCGSCSDGKANGAESDVDCGGACAGCPGGSKCHVDADCSGLPCQSYRCGGCSDGVKDGLESDVDCGGPVCQPCALGEACTSKSDCASKGCDTTSHSCCLTNACGTCGPAPVEKCNGLDDDCNGVKDDLATAPACANQSGVCAGATGECKTGYVVCNYAAIAAHQSTETLCDKLDNDCDGATDETTACPYYCDSPLVESYPLASSPLTNGLLSDRPLGVRPAVGPFPAQPLLTASMLDGTERRLVELSGGTSQIVSASALSGAVVTFSESGKHVTSTALALSGATRIDIYAMFTPYSLASANLSANLLASFEAAAGYVGEPIPVFGGDSGVAVLAPLMVNGQLRTVGKVFNLSLTGGELQSSVVGVGWSPASRVVLAPDGTAHAFLTMGALPMLQHVVFGSVDVTFLDSLSDRRCAPVVAKDGSVHVAYASALPGEVRISKRSVAGVWSPPTTISSSSGSRVDAVEDSDGGIAVAWVGTSGAVLAARLEPSGVVTQLGGHPMTSVAGATVASIRVEPANASGIRLVLAALMQGDKPALSSFNFCAGY